MSFKYLSAFLLATLPLATFSQPCYDYPCVIKKAKRALHAKDYTNAFLQLEAAAAYPSSKPEEVKALRQQLFESINREKRRANQKAKEAEEALASLRQSNARVVQLLLENVEYDIYKLQYEPALEKIKTAAELGVLQEEVTTAYLEVAFWHNEAGHTWRALGILDSAAILVGKKELATSLQPLPEDSLAVREKIRAALQQLGPSNYQMLWERYYPIMVDVPGGTFTMGCNPEIDSLCNYFDETQHPATVSHFQIAKTETTCWQYYLFCQGTGRRWYDSPGWGNVGDNPAVNINWYDALAYANWVSRQMGMEEAVVVEGDVYRVNHFVSGYRLPTEAEWEYAARGGRAEQRYIYSGSNTLDSVGWYNANSRSRTQPVGLLQANALGLHDMSGNVWEWCWDRYDSYSDGLEPDYARDLNFSLFGSLSLIVRGGSWASDDYICRSSERGGADPVEGHSVNGFRLARSR